MPVREPLGLRRSRGVAQALGYGISFRTLDINVDRLAGSSMSVPLLAVSIRPAEKLVAAGGAHRDLTTRGGAVGEYVMSTGKKAASDASKILRSKPSTKKEKEVVAFDPSQARKAKGGKKK